MHRHHKNIVTAGIPLGKANKAMIMVHGRGATAQSILEVANYLNVDGFALLAPQASANTWYPFGFMAPMEQNEPGLSTGLGVINQIIGDIHEQGISTENIYFLGFSQGACLSCEYLARHAKRYGGAFIFTGGVIGHKIDRTNYKGDFLGTPILIGCSDKDPHVPLHRVNDTAAIFRDMGADVTERIYPDAPHSILKEEIELSNIILLA